MGAYHERHDEEFKMTRIKRFYQNHMNLILGAVGVGSFMSLWQYIGSTGIINPLFTSYPTQILQAAYELFSTGFIYKHLWVSAQEFILGYALAVIFGIILGILVGWYKVFYGLLNPFITSIYTAPRVALMPLFILWLGIGLESKVLVIFLGAIFPILINTMIGMKSVDASLVKVARSFGANDFKLFKTVALPFSTPFILAGLRLAIARALLGMVFAEFYGARGGIGYLLTLYGATFQTDKLMVMILIIIIVGLSLTELIHLFEKKFEVWRPTIE